jgi:hypothetical protein
MPVEQYRVGAAVEIQFGVDITLESIVTHADRFIFIVNIDRGRAQTEIKRFRQTDTEVETDPVYTGLGRNTKVERIGIRCKQKLSQPQEHCFYHADDSSRKLMAKALLE